MVYPEHIWNAGVMPLSNEVLDEMFRTGQTQTPGGDFIDVHSQIERPYAEALHGVVLREGFEDVLEVGFAFGVSSLAILTALDDLGRGSLTSLDPLQDTDWQDCGVHAVERSGLAGRHTLIRQPDYLAMPALLADARAFDLIYIDGWHTFDYTLLDLFFAGKLLKIGGVIGLNDGGFPAVHAALLAFLAHRDYVEIDVGLMPEFWNREGAQVGANAADRYFRKVSDHEPDWDFHTAWWSAAQVGPTPLRRAARHARHRARQLRNALTSR